MSETHKRLRTPYYLIDERRMLPTLQRIQRVERKSQAKSVLALKCFSSWCAFDLMKQYLAGTTSSGLYEARLGFEKFGGETHGYSVAFDDEEVSEAAQYCDKMIFNSLSQLERFSSIASQCSVGLRLNPEIGSSHYELSNPVGRYSRLGVKAEQLPEDIFESIDGAMTHVNCENDNFESFCEQLARIEVKFGHLLPHLKWFSLGGGIAFTDPSYPLEEFCAKLNEFSRRYEVQLYLEPGEAAVSNSTSLVVRVLDVVRNVVPTLIVDAGVETQLLDVLTYQFTPELEGARALPREGDLTQFSDGYVYRVCGRTCLAGDHFGNYVFSQPVEAGAQLTFSNVAGYSMVKKNFFNGIRMPDIYHQPLEGELRRVQSTSYENFRDSLS